MAKRVADKQLTHENWDAEDESEEPGTFKRVEASALANRVIRKARRSIPSQSTESPSSSPFAKFAGFSSVKKSNSCNFASKEKTGSTMLQMQDVKKLKRKQNGSDTCTVTPASELEDSSAKALAESFSNSGKKPESRDVEYYRLLKALNESVFQWIESHLSKNPLCDFTPVFNDYKKHLESIEKKFPLKAKRQCIKQPPCSFPFKIPSSPSRTKPENLAPDNDGNSSSQKASKLLKFESSKMLNKALSPCSLEMLYGAGFASNTTNTSTFSFGIKDYSTSTVSGSPLGPASSSFASNKNDETSEDEKSSFTFSSITEPSGTGTVSNLSEASGSPDKKPFSFAAVPVAPVIPKEQKNNDISEDGEYEPPKNDFTEVSEEGSFFSKRCKLFYKKDDSYVEKGVGTLFLKSLKEKIQLVIRADTSLGNILLNIIINDSLPMQRMGKNNVLIVCVPNPPIATVDSDAKIAIPLLIRVKTGEEADELFDMLNKHKL